VRIIFNKYFITILSFLLILSNFSYAASVMVCSMMGKGNTDKCTCQKTDNTRGIKFKKVKDSCCEQQTLNLSNSNNLLHQKDNELTKQESVISCNGIDTDVQTNYIGITYNRLDRLKAPLDLPILYSSLLI